MPKRKREDDDDDYVNFCSGLQKNSKNGLGDNSYIYCTSRPYKRPKINPNFHRPARPYYKYLDPEDDICKKIQRLITNDSIVIDDIVEVKNAVLEEAYYSKKDEKTFLYGDQLTEALLFHGTKECNLASICTFNFDWRLTGSNKGHKFGKGVCFSPNAKYASNYSDHNSYYKVMIVAKVLIANVCQGSHDMSIPPQGYDTSQKGDNGIVLVKYDDNEFLPAYVLYYHFKDVYDTEYSNNNVYYNNYQYDYRYHGRYCRYDYYGSRRYDSRHHYYNHHNYRYNKNFYNSNNVSDQGENYSYDDYYNSASYLSF